MDKLENSLESKIVHKMAGVIDKRMNTEAKNIRKECDNKIQNFKDDIRQDISEIEAKLNSITDATKALSPTSSKNNRRDCNFVIKGLPFHEGENLNAKVNSLISDGMGIKSITVLKTHRNSSDGSDGIVIASLQATEERKTILNAKRKLKDSEQYKKVFIYKDQTTEERTVNRNLKTIVNVLRDNGCNISVHGDRVVEENCRSHRGTHGGNSRYRANRNSSNYIFSDRQNSFSGYSRKNHSSNAYSQKYTNDRHSSFSDNDNHHNSYDRDSQNASSARSSFHDRSRNSRFYRDGHF
jgi:hypothetical protein